MMKTKRFNVTKTSALWLCLIALCCIGHASSVRAQMVGDENANGGGGGGEIAPQPCDPDYWDTMSARAWMEAEREIMQNQNLIFKPDSVLQYTCFDNMVSHAAKYLGDIFVHTDYFGKVIIARGSAQAQEIALQNVVTTTLKSFIDLNFQNKFLANRSDKLRNKPAQVERRSGAGLVEATSMSPYQGCNIMAEVWKASKCINFIDNDEFKNTDGFYPFRTLKPGPGSDLTIIGYDSHGDIRHWPQLCADPVKGQEWVDKDDVATNKDEQYPFRDPLKKDFEDVRKMVEPGACSLNSSGIETGVTIIISGGGSGSGKPDKVCTNPGCTYVGSSCQ